MSFVGSYQMKIDNKNRVRLPAKFRSKLPDGFYLNFGTNCITICSIEEGNRKIDELFEEAETPKELECARKLSHLMYEVQPEDQDEQGRFVVPQKFVKYAKLEKDIWFLGERDSISLMSDEEYCRMNGEDDILALGLEIDKMMLRKNKRKKSEKKEEK
ncbi:MAG: hypothetical protein J5993_03485 [Clostridia bacterium]|nr:hypothetical protein [Clostridia bacterium]